MTAVVERLNDQVGNNGNKGEALDWREFNLRQAFALVSKDIQSAPRIWVRIKFSNGATCGPTLYEKPLSEQQKRNERVKAWFDGLDANDELARFRETEFLLTRLNEVIADLTHLYFVGEYHVFSTGPVESKQSSELVINLAKLSGSRTITLPPIWENVTVKGRLVGGGFTPSFKVTNKKSACGCSVLPVDSSPGFSALETYIYIAYDQHGTPQDSIVPFLNDPNTLHQVTLSKCKSTRLILMSMRPANATNVKHYADKQFKKPLEFAIPGPLYVRYLDAEGQTVGFSAYQMSTALVQQWAYHAMAHVAAPTDVERIKKESLRHQR